VAKLRLSVLLSLLLIAFPAVVKGQESVRTPNDKGAGCPAGVNNTNVSSTLAAGRRMNIRVVSGKVPAVTTDDTGSIALSACQSGQAVTHAGSSKLCSAAQTKGFTCQGFFTGPFEACGPLQPLSCCDATIDPTVRGVSADCSITGLGGFTIGRDPGAAGADTGEKVQLGDSTPNTINAVNSSTNGGNTITSDPLPQHLEGLVRNGIDGVVQWKVFHSQGGSNPRTFNVNTTGLTDTQIAQAIATGFQGLGLGLTASVHPSSQAAFYSRYPQAFFQDDFVVIPDTVSHGVIEIQVTAIEGQQITIEDNVPGGNVPTLSTVGMALLIALLMLGALVLHRRQRLLQT